MKPKFERNQYGFVFGGPIVRNQTFFFTDFEGFRQTRKRTDVRQHPDPAMRDGNLGKPIFNPLTGETYANGVIPASAITPFAKKVLAGLPQPTLPGIANNFDSLPERTDFNDKFDVKIDHTFSAKMTAFGRVQPPQPRELRAVVDSRRDRQPEQRVRARRRTRRSPAA